MDTTWASDLFVSTSVSTIRLFEPRCIEKQMQIFQYDALKLLPEDKINSLILKKVKFINNFLNFIQ